MLLPGNISTTISTQRPAAKTPLVIHPYLFAIYPILFLVQHNLGGVSYSDILLPTTAILIISCLFMFLFKLLVKNIYKTGVIVTAFFILFSLYGHSYNLLRNFQGFANCDLGLFIIWVILFIGLWYLVKGLRSDCHRLTVVFNIVAIILVVLALLNIGIYMIKNPAFFATKGSSHPKTTISTAEMAKLPDIYYIILDSYASAGALKELYHYDNRKFMNHLKTKGFYIASNSQSNYPMTFLSLASSLNMEYINFLSEKMGTQPSDNEEAPIQMIKNNAEMNFLKSKGYKLINFNSGWTGTSDIQNVDVNYELGRVNEFLSLYVNSTVLIYFEKNFHFLEDNQRRRILRTFQKLAEIPKIKEPTFTFAHLLVPHGPYIFGAKGEEIPVKEFAKITTAEIQQKYYRNQLIYINQKVTELIDKILGMYQPNSSSKVEPIIILQGDHGPDSLWWGTGWGENPTDEILRERFGILNAYYLPNQGRKMLFESLSPVNTFRVIDNYYFGANYELLPDKSYFSTYRDAYTFTDVTDRIRFALQLSK